MLTGDQKFLERVRQATTIEAITAIVEENEDYFGHDPYYADLRKAMMKQLAKIQTLARRDSWPPPQPEEFSGPGIGEWDDLSEW